MTRCQKRIAAQDARRDELAQLRATRPLTDAELAEEARLENALYFRTYQAEKRLRAILRDDHREAA